MVKVTTALGMMILCLTALAACQPATSFDNMTPKAQPQTVAETTDGASGLKAECAVYKGTGIIPERCEGMT